MPLLHWEHWWEWYRRASRTREFILFSINQPYWISATCKIVAKTFLYRQSCFLYFVSSHYWLYTTHTKRKFLLQNCCTCFFFDLSYLLRVALPGYFSFVFLLNKYSLIRFVPLKNHQLRRTETECITKQLRDTVSEILDCRLNVDSGKEKVLSIICYSRMPFLRSENHQACVYKTSNVRKRFLCKCTLCNI